MIAEFKSITVPVFYTLVNFDEVRVLSPDTLPDSRAAGEGLPLTIQPNSRNGGSLSDLLLDPMTCCEGEWGGGCCQCQAEPRTARVKIYSSRNSGCV